MDTLGVPGGGGGGGGTTGGKPNFLVGSGTNGSGQRQLGGGTAEEMGSGSSGGSRLGSRVLFSSKGEITIDANEEERMPMTSTISLAEAESVCREGWDNKMQFYMGVVSYAVGLGNVWRFPYLCQKNGGGAFLIPYAVMMVIGGLPLFIIELGIGQRLRTGPVGVWSAISPLLGGVGISAAIVSYLVALYYNVIITWCLFYLWSSFSFVLPWGECPREANGTVVQECAKSSSVTMYFWNRKALDTSPDIGSLNGFTYHILVALFLSWLLVYVCVMKGIKSSGKVMYATATFPYVVTTIFLIRSSTLDGALHGLGYMLSPDLSKLYEPLVWLDAATQIFYSMGLGFGGLIAFGSYNKVRNNCVRDACILSGINFTTSLYTAVVVFNVLGYMAHNTMKTCVQSSMTTFAARYPAQFASAEAVQAAFGEDAYLDLMSEGWKGFEKMRDTKTCDYATTISEAAEGAGLAFVVFTEAILKFPFAPFWSVLFFLMLLALGLGSMFGTLEGVITSLNDSQLITVKKPVMTAVLCASAFFIGIIFTTKAGQYWVSLFDAFAGSYALMCVAFFEIVAVVYVYGYSRFAADIDYMTGYRPGFVLIFLWRFVTPIIMFGLFVISVGQSFSNPPKYFAYDPETTHQHFTSYPGWAMVVAVAMVVLTIFPVPFIAFLRNFHILERDAGPPAQRWLGTSASTTAMLRSANNSFSAVNGGNANGEDPRTAVADAANKRRLLQQKNQAADKPQTKQ